MTDQFLNHLLECPYCQKVRLRIPAHVVDDTPIACSDCGEYLGTWDELQDSFEQQGGQDGVFRLDKGRIRKIE